MCPVPTQLCASATRVALLTTYWQSYQHDRGRRALDRYFLNVEYSLKPANSREVEHQQYRRLLAK